MSINAQDKVNLLVLVRDLWLDANAHSHAYDRALRVSKQRSDWLKLGTIVSALLTAATGFVETVWLTVVIGLLTTALASIERLFLPAETYSKQSECKYKLEGLKRKLTSFSMTLDAVPDLLVGNQSLDNMGNELIDVKREMAVSVSPDDSKTSKDDFRGSTVAHLLEQARIAAGQPLPAAESPVSELAEDAPDVVEVFRLHASGT